MCVCPDSLYGEITIESYVTIMSVAYSLKRSANGKPLEGLKIVDLGCGSGVALSATVLLRMLLQKIDVDEEEDNGDLVGGACASRAMTLPLKFEALGIALCIGLK